MILLLFNGQYATSVSFNSYGGYLKELEYSSCEDKYLYLYNADEQYLYLTINPSLIQTSKSFYFLNNGKQINSIFKENKDTVEEDKPYNTGEIFFKLNQQDYDYVEENDNKYEIKFSSTNNYTSRTSQTCTLTIHIKSCEKEECKYWNYKGDCWDNNMKKIFFKTDLEKYFFIIPIAILGMLIVLIFFSFAKCCIREQIPNFEGGNLQNELPLIT